jgi:hypothetical protein
MKTAKSKIELADSESESDLLLFWPHLISAMSFSVIELSTFSWEISEDAATIGAIILHVSFFITSFFVVSIIARTSEAVHRAFNRIKWLHISFMQDLRIIIGEAIINVENFIGRLIQIAAKLTFGEVILEELLEALLLPQTIPIATFQFSISMDILIKADADIRTLGLLENTR